MIAYLLKSATCLGLFLVFYHLVLEKEKTWENGLFFIENLVGLKNENIKLNL